MDELKVIYEDMVKELIHDANHKRVKTSAGYEVKETNKPEDKIIDSLCKKFTKISVFIDSDIEIFAQRKFIEDTACKVIAFYAKDHFMCNNPSQLKACHYSGNGAFRNLDDATLDKIVRYARQMR